MAMPHPLRAAAVAAAFMLAGCFSTSDIRTYGDLSGARGHALRVMTVDTVLYDLDRFTFTDSLLSGEGERVAAGRRQTFAGEIPLSRIVYVQTREVNVLGSLLCVGVIGLAAEATIQTPLDRGMSVYRKMGGDGILGNGSCPYISAWNGSVFVRQGEAFGTALGKGLETSTDCLLPAAAADDGIVRVRVSNERPETHYVNSVEVLAYEVAKGAGVGFDTHGNAWPLTEPLPPRRAPASLMCRDGVWWQSPATRPAGSYRDTVEIVVPLSAGATEGSFIVHAINTHTVDGAFGRLMDFLGDEELPCLYRMEHDTSMIGLLKGWIGECGLHVDVWDGSAWTTAGTILPEANEVPFTRIVRIAVPRSGGDTVRARLRMLDAMWNIDDVAVDWSDVQPLVGRTLPLLTARHNVTGPVEEQLRASDSAYARLLPGEQVDMEFRATPPPAGKSTIYACRASGFLYEWSVVGPGAVNSGRPALPYGMSRTDVVTCLLEHHDLFLSLLYDRHALPAMPGME